MAPEEIEEVGVGKIVEGTVTGIAPFGAFVALPNGKTGLVHISEIADVYVRDIKDFVKENDRVKVKILSMDENGKIGLSIRQAQPGASATREREGDRRARRGRSDRGTGGHASFEDKLARFMRESEDRLHDLRRSTDAKRGGRGAGR
ncbi:putative RNA degradation protein; polyribonucleotide nucleotidyltransferase or phosphorylase [Candidatus Hydrogenisulfobacillus filiaventi]|uniref:Putative RNA degradation protein polyribonucleotide nucleotidyltransferase or phosphorylase n=1 Tax=Candidatus Hydrogenisulfobacillus filiaventi TaxID=2707344 RepID=A0A6F8ZK93_9FIRM|nr:S1 RNA-binding domain-containing protein [Bacillota bacterium]CAB1130103.1 putative RNA degradation protein; polyribonucleotide nucleotidyltransferase or phosphorylase [Candidatus Hydrogenisulfobacillus filiaventi]